MKTQILSLHLIARDPFGHHLVRIFYSLSELQTRESKSFAKWLRPFTNLITELHLGAILRRKSCCTVVLSQVSVIITAVATSSQDANSPLCHRPVMQLMTNKFFVSLSKRKPTCERCIIAVTEETGQVFRIIDVSYADREIVNKLCPGVPLFGFTRAFPTIFGSIG